MSWRIGLKEAAKKSLFVARKANASKASQIREVTSDEFSDLVDAAQTYYDQALQLNSDYARAQLGWQHQIPESIGDPHAPERQPDLELLSEAEQAFLRALQSPAPESANIPAKVSFGLGLIHRVKAVASQSSIQNGSVENPGQQLAALQKN